MSAAEGRASSLPSLALQPSSRPPWPSTFCGPIARSGPLSSIAAPALAGSGFLAASVHVLAYHGIILGPTWHTPASLAVLRMLPAPLLVTAFVLAAFIAPTCPSRLALPGPRPSRAR